MTDPNSDDEFQDALGEQITRHEETAPQLDEKDVDKIVEQQSHLSLGGEKEDSAAGDGADETKKPIDAELTIEELRELEKDLSPEELEANKKQANKLKLEGNELFKNDQADGAVKVYTEALNVCPSENARERAVLFGNRAAAKMKLEANKSAIDDCTKAIELWPEYLRALLR